MKNFNKKVINLCISFFIIILFVFNVSAFATTVKTVDVTNKFSKSSIKAGETFTQTIGLENFSGVVKGIQAAMFVVNYESSNFSCEVFTNSSQIYLNELTITKTANQLAITYLDSSKAESPITMAGAVIAVQFTANSNLVAKDYKFTLSSGVVSEFADCDYTSMDVKPIFSQNATQIIQVLPEKTVKPTIYYSSSERNVDFTMSNKLSVINNESILTLTIGTNNWINVVNGITALNIKIGYDGNTFEYKNTVVTEESKIQIGRDMFTAVVANKDVLGILYMDNDFTTPVPSECDLFNITFKVKDGAFTGGYRFNLYGDNVVVDGQLPKTNSIPVYYPSMSTVFINGLTPPVSSSLTSSVSSLVSSSTSSQANVSSVKSTTEKIEALPEKITIKDEAAVEKALDEYNGLTETEKQKVVNYDKLEKSDATINKLVVEKNKSLLFIIVVLVVILALIAFSVILVLKLQKKKVL